MKLQIGIRCGCIIGRKTFVREATEIPRPCLEIRIMIDAASRDITGRRGFGNEIERNGAIERAENGVRAENGRTVCKSAERRGGWLRAERHREVIRKWNTYRSHPRVGLGTVIDGWWVDWLHRDRPLGDWPLSGVSITTSSSPAAYEGNEGRTLPTNPRSFLRKALPRSHPSFLHPDLRPPIFTPAPWNGFPVYIMRGKKFDAANWLKRTELVKARVFLHPRICEMVSCRYKWRIDAGMNVRHWKMTQTISLTRRYDWVKLQMILFQCTFFMGWAPLILMWFKFS